MPTTFLYPDHFVPGNEMGNWDNGALPLDSGLSAEDTPRPTGVDSTCPSRQSGGPGVPRVPHHHLQHQVVGFGVDGRGEMPPVVRRQDDGAPVEEFEPARKRSFSGNPTMPGSMHFQMGLPHVQHFQGVGMETYVAGGGGTPGRQHGGADAQGYTHHPGEFKGGGLPGDEPAEPPHKVRQPLPYPLEG